MCGSSGMRRFVAECAVLRAPSYSPRKKKKRPRSGARDGDILNLTWAFCSRRSNHYYLTC
ncbi:unnamed protein product [Amoebophrya sp. A25]|nr:unnamed protein product [Amoebophrya sp. A25]|eukprot:GSA25T00021777001.1